MARSVRQMGTLLRFFSFVFGSALAMTACRTREDAAQKAGREGAARLARVCKGSPADPTCRDPIYQDACASFADSPHLLDECKTRCAGEGICRSDADCDPGSV